MPSCLRLIDFEIAQCGVLRIPVIIHNNCPRCPVDADMPVLALFDVVVEEVQDCMTIILFPAAPATKLTWRKLRKIYTGWRLWAFIFPYLMVAQAGQGSGYFNLWLKDQGYSTAQVNTIPTAGNALSVVASLFFGTIADRTGTRAETCIVVCLIVIVSNIMLSIWNIPRAGLLFAFFLSFVSAAAQPLIIAWGQEVTQDNAELRQMLVATGNIFTYMFSAWIPLVLFPTYDAPYYKYGYQILILFGGLAIVGVWFFGYLDKWDRKRKAARATADQEGAIQTGRQQQVD